MRHDTFNEHHKQGAASECTDRRDGSAPGASPQKLHGCEEDVASHSGNVRSTAGVLAFVSQAARFVRCRGIGAAGRSRRAAGECVAGAVSRAGALERPGGGEAPVHGRQRAAAAVLQAGQGAAPGGCAAPRSLLAVEGYVLQMHLILISARTECTVVVQRCNWAIGLGSTISEKYVQIHTYNDTRCLVCRRMR